VRHSSGDICIFKICYDSKKDDIGRVDATIINDWNYPSMKGGCHRRQDPILWQRRHQTRKNDVITGLCLYMLRWRERSWNIGWGPGEISCSILSPAVFFALRLKHAFSNVTHAHQQKFIVEGSWSTNFIFDCTASLRPRPTNCRPRSSFIGNVKESRGISPQQQDKQKLLTNNSF